MREHMGLFRGKRTDNGEWVEGYLWVNTSLVKAKIPHITDGDGVICEVDPATVGECTGLIDKNGILIFEGDIVLKRTYNGKKPFPVTYNAGMFHCGYGGGSSTPTHGYTLDDKRIEIIGNRYDNPELIT